MPDDRHVAPVTARLPPPDITPAQFERFVVELLESVRPSVEAFEVTLHDKVRRVDGAYDFDATVRFRFGGMAFLVLVEAKRHRNPIKRELVQVLHSKLLSVGAQKAAMIATQSYQRGALTYAREHGIALATVTEGRLTYETRRAYGAPAPTRQQPSDDFGVPAFVAYAYGPGDTASSTRITTLSADHPAHVAEALFAIEL